MISDCHHGNKLQPVAEYLINGMLINTKVTDGMVALNIIG